MSGKRVEDPRCASLKNGELQVIADTTEQAFCPPLIIYPEARYANVGTNSHLTPSIAKLAKLLKVPVVTINMQGNYLQQPIWNLKERKGARLHADLKCVVTQDEIGKLSVDEILSRISKELTRRKA